MGAISTRMSKSYRWYEVWGKVYLHPFEESFREILEDPKFHIRRAFFWMAISGAVAGFLDSASSSGPGWTLTDALLLGGFLGLLLTMLVFLLIALPLAYSQKKNFTEKDKNRFVYCLAAAFAPATLVYGFLLAAGQVLAKVSLNFYPVLNALAVILTVYLFWLVKNAIRAYANLAPEMTRTVDSIFKRLARNGGLLALTILGFGAVYFFYFSPVQPARIIVYFVSLVFFMAAVVFVLRLAADLIELSDARQLSTLGQVAGGKVLKKWEDQWEVYYKGLHSTKFTYYAIFEYSVMGAKHLLTRMITADEYQRLDEGGAIQVRYLPDKPEIVQLMGS